MIDLFHNPSSHGGTVDMDVEEGHENADLYGLVMEKVVLEMSFDFYDFPIRWRDDGTLGGGGSPARVPEKKDDEKGDSAKNSGEINPPH